MIGLLDPALFLPRDTKQVQQELDLIIQICRKHAVALVPLSEYWNQLWSDLARPLEKQLTPEAKRSLQELRKFAASSTLKIPPLSPQSGTVWRRGFRELFGPDIFPTDWEEPIMRAALQALTIQRPVILLTRRMPGRNVRRHAAGGTTLEEITRWRLFVQPKIMGTKQIYCIYHPRNIQERWTVRFDWRLPTVSDGADYPFCPPAKWWNPSTEAFRTICSKPAWVDKLGNGWARPNIPGGAGYHWDVFIQSPQLQEKVGLSQVNVVEFGAPITQGKPGTIHHVPGEKRGKVTDTGWTC